MNRLFPRWTTSLSPAAALACLLALAATAAAQQPPLEVHYGFGGHARPGCWTPVLVEARQGLLGRSFEGRAGIYPSGGSGAERGRFETQVLLTAAESEASAGVERFWLYVRPGRDLYRGTAYLQAEGHHRLFSDRPLGKRPFEESTTLFLVAGRSVGLQESLLTEVKLADGGTHRPFNDYEAAQVDIQRLPDRPIGYDGVNVLVLVNPQVDRDLRQDQLEAIVSFVETGGQLVLFVSRHWQETARSRLADVIPASLGPLVQVDDTLPISRVAGVGSERIDGELAVPSMTPRARAGVLLSSRGVPVVVRGMAGMGSVTLVGLDAESQALRAWRDMPVFVVNLLRLIYEPPISIPERDFVTGDMAEDFIKPRGGFGSLAFVWAIILMVGGYVFLSGPLLHLLLRGLRRLDLSWPAYFALSLAVAASCFTAVWFLRNRQTLVRTVTIADFPADGRAASGRSWYSVRFADSSLYEIALEARQGYVALKPAQDLLLGVLSSGDRLFRYHPTLLGIDDLAVKSNQFRYLESRWRSPAPPPTVPEVAETASGFRGTIRNGDVAVTHAVLVGPRFACRLPPRLEPGQTVALRDRPCQDTPQFLRDEFAKTVLGEEKGPHFAYYPPPQDQEETSARDILADVGLCTCYEAYRRLPLEPRDSPWSGGKVHPCVTRRGSAAKLDLTHVLDSGQAILMGVAELPIPDGLSVDGKKPASTERLVIFRQVVPLLAPDRR